MIFNFILLPPAPCWKLPFLFQPTYPPDTEITLPSAQHLAQAVQRGPGVTQS